MWAFTHNISIQERVGEVCTSHDWQTFLRVIRRSKPSFLDSGVICPNNLLAYESLSIAYYIIKSYVFMGEGVEKQLQISPQIPWLWRRGS